MAMVVYDKKDKSAQAVVAWVIAVLTLFYMLPWAVAATRGKSNSLAIALLNFFLGWTFIGWVASMVMACSAHQAVGMAHQPANGPYTPGYPYPGYPQTAHQSVGYPQLGHTPPSVPPALEPAAPRPEPTKILPAAGWYPVEGTTRQRYWDGARWTDHYTA